MASIPATPLVPPEIRQQQQPAPVPIFMGAGQQAMSQVPSAQGLGAPSQMLREKIFEFGQWLNGMMSLVPLHKPLGPLVLTLAQVGKALEQNVGQLEEQEQAGGGALPGPPPTPNPAEGVPQGV